MLRPSLGIYGTLHCTFKIKNIPYAVPGPNSLPASIMSNPRYSRLLRRFGRFFSIFSYRKSSTLFPIQRTRIQSILFQDHIPVSWASHVTDLTSFLVCVVENSDTLHSYSQTHTRGKMQLQLRDSGYRKCRNLQKGNHVTCLSEHSVSWMTLKTGDFLKAKQEWSLSWYNRLPIFCPKHFSLFLTHTQITK